MHDRSVVRGIVRHPSMRYMAILLLGVAASLTLLLVCRTFWFLFHSVTNVPYADQWYMLEEIQRVREGHSRWTYLWSPYWGQRILLPRLVFLVSAKYLHFSMWPFILINVASQISMVAVLFAVVRRVLHPYRIAFWASVIAIVHLLLSSLQMEIFIEAIGIQYTVGYASAVASICVMGTAFDRKVASERRFWIAALLGVMSTTCFAIGLLVWPILIFEVWFSGAWRRRHLVTLTALTVVLIAAYVPGYTRPEMGMGALGIIRHPISALSIVALILGGSVSLYSRPIGIVAGSVGLVTACGVLIHVRRNRGASLAETSLAMVCCFLLASALSIAVGRISPEWLAGTSGQPLPSRYLAPTFVFWAALFPLLLSYWHSGRSGRIGGAAASVIVLMLTFGTWNWQWRMPAEWAGIFQSFDAIGSGFVVAVSDQAFMSRLFPVEDLRERLVNYMREQHLSIFAEPRSTWMGRNMGSIALRSNERKCFATMPPAISLDGTSSTLRVFGTLTVDEKPVDERLDVLITDSQGTVIGLARTIPAQRGGNRATDFFGYARNAERNALSTLRLIIVFADKAWCVAQVL